VLTLPPEAPPPPRPASRLQDLAHEVASALEFMAARFGPPATKLLNVSPVPGRFGQGFPGLIYLSTLSYLGPGSKPLASLNERQQAFFSDILHAHETAHQWWGNVVTSDGYRDDWLMEALANYSALLHLEKRKGARSLEAALDEYRALLLERTGDGQSVESSGPVVLGARLLSSQHPDAWRRIVYGKGSWILHMLRRRLGDDAFLSMLGALRKKFEGASLTTEQFRLHAAGFLPARSPDPKLEAFFEQWVYGAGIPRFEFKHAVKGKAPNVRLTGAIAQREVDGDYLAEVPIEVQFRRGKPRIVWLPASSESRPFNISLREVPVRVVFNPGRAVLLRD
jgi:aminopeptidase N